MIKAIISDAGGVIQVWENTPVYYDIKHTLGLSDELFQQIYTTLIPLLGTGNIKEDEFWKLFLEKVQTNRPLPKESLFLRQYRKNFHPTNEVLNLFKGLKENGYKMALLSNSIEPHTEYNKQRGLYDVFDVRVISNEVGLMKPDIQIYKLVLNRLQVDPEEAVFIDDLQENIEAANSIGIKGILFRDIEDLKREMRKLNLAI